MSTETKVKSFRFKKFAQGYLAKFKLVVPVVVLANTEGKKVNKRELKKNLKNQANIIAALTQKNLQTFLQEVTKPTEPVKPHKKSRKRPRRKR